MTQLDIAESRLLLPTGLDAAALERTFGALLGPGIDFGDLYFQHSRREGWSMEDGIVKDGSHSIEQGVGVRAISGEKTGFAYSDEIDAPALFAASRSARAIAREPEIIFFDEPTTGLDPIMADVINDLIVKCVSDLGATAVSITHDMASARKIGHRIGMLHEGRLIWQGPVADIDRSGNAYVDQFIHGRAEGPIRMQVRKL